MHICSVPSFILIKVTRPLKGVVLGHIQPRSMYSYSVSQIFTNSSSLSRYSRGLSSYLCSSSRSILYLVLLSTIYPGY